MSINVVLVEPEIPQNTGNIIRTCAATGATLHLVRPLGFSLEDKYLKRSGLDYWDIANIKYYDSFEEVVENKLTWAAEHIVGIAKDVPEDIKDGLRANFMGECSEVGMYLAMARVAAREGYPEIALYWEKAAYEEAEHAAKFAELLGEELTDSTKKNLEMRVAAENGATLGKFELAKKAKELNLDAIHDTVHEMARDEARHGKAFAGLLERYYGK